MEKVLQSIVALSGLCVISSHVQRQFHVVYEPKDFSEALSHCREKYTDLVSVQNEEEMKLLRGMVDLNKMIDAGNTDQAWIGMTYDKDRWRWSLSDPSFYKEGETEFRMWNSGEPNGPYTEHCVSLTSNQSWNDHYCNTLYPAVCSDVRGSDVRFVYIANRRTWARAQSYCRTHFTDLVSVRNMAEQKMLKRVVPSRAIWIGLRRDPWTWSDGSQSSFRYWKDKGNTNAKRCVAANFKNFGKWQKPKCDSKRASICYSAFSGYRQMIKVKFVSSNSSLDLNDPMVMEDISKQLKQNLKDQGLNEDVRLSWRKQADGNVFHREEEEEEEDKKMDC